MGDVANILGIQSKAALSTAETAQAILAGSTSAAPAKKKPKKPKGMSREVYDLMGPDGLVPAMETSQKVHSGSENSVSIFGNPDFSVFVENYIFGSVI